MVRHEHLIEGGAVFYRVQLQLGSQSEVRLKPARVLDVEAAGATIQVLDEERPRTVRFASLDPDVDYLARQWQHAFEQRTRRAQVVQVPQPLEQEPPAQVTSSSSEPVVDVQVEDVTAQEKGEREMAKKSTTTRYTDEQREQVRAALAEGLPLHGIAEKYGVSYWTVRNLSKIYTTKRRGKTAARTLAVVPKRSAARVGRVPAEARVEADEPSAQRRNRSLRAMLSALLDRQASADFAAQNRQLQAVIDMLLGIN